MSNASPTMTAIAIEGGRGPAAALHPETIARPTPKPGEVLIAVKAAGVNRPDIFQRMGAYPPPPGAPSTLGLEVAGEVAALGDGVTAWTLGDRVCALLGGGGYAEYAVADARHALPVPAGLSWIEAAALPETVFTVFANVWEGGRLQPGETLMLHGATSGIGVSAIQMAKAYGAKVIATSRGAQKTAAAKALGADVSIDSRAEDFVAVAAREGGADVILDMLGGEIANRNLEALKPGGRCVMIGQLAGGRGEIDLMRIMRNRLTLTGSTLRPRSADEKARLARAVHDTVWPWIEAGKVRLPVDATFPLAEAAAAHAHLEQGEHIGKVVLTVGDGAPQGSPA